jgi:hypothetical protein
MLLRTTPIAAEQRRRIFLSMEPPANPDAPYSPPTPAQLNELRALVNLRYGFEVSQEPDSRRIFESYLRGLASPLSRLLSGTRQFALRGIRRLVSSP